jgi:hypothetical protein
MSLLQISSLSFDSCAEDFYIRDFTKKGITKLGIETSGLLKGLLEGSTKLSKLIVGNIAGILPS